MRKSQNRHPLDSYFREGFERNGTDTKAGRLIRQGDARTRLREMDECEAAVVRRLEEVATIADELSRHRAQVKLDTQYMIQFGVMARHRNVFRTLLIAAVESGGASLREIAGMVYKLGGE